MRCIFFTHEENVVGIRRKESGFNGFGAGVGNGPGRQSANDIGVVGRGRGQILARQVAVEIGDAIDNGRIGLQPHAAFQPVVEHCRDQRPLEGRAGFFFDDRGQRHNGMHTHL